jgi:predicted dehydrogenase
MGGRCYEEAGNLFDHYTVEYTFPDGTKLFAFSRHMANCWNTYADYAHGSKGSAVLMATLAQPNTRIYKGHDMAKENLVWEFGRPDPNPYVVEWQLLLDAIRQDKPHNEAHRAGEAEIAALMGRAATHMGKEVTWDQVMQSDFQYIDDIDNLSFDTPAPIHDGPDGIYPCPQPGISEEL